MIPTHLEELIWKGKAEAKTFMVGGTTKHNIHIDKDCFIVIYQLVYFPVNNATLTNDLNGVSENSITQVNIFSEKKFNHFIFRNHYNPVQATPPDQVYNLPGSPTVVPVYLMHEKDLTVLFLKNFRLTPTVTAVSPDDVETKAPPLGMGNGADPGAIPVIQQSFTIPNNFTQPVGDAIKPPAFPTNYELWYPTDPGTAPPNPQQTHQMPIMQVHYVKVFGRMPKNLNN